MIELVVVTDAAVVSQEKMHSPVGIGFCISICVRKALGGNELAYFELGLSKAVIGEHHAIVDGVSSGRAEFMAFRAACKYLFVTKHIQTFGSALHIMFCTDSHSLFAWQMKAMHTFGKGQLVGSVCGKDVRGSAEITRFFKILYEYAGKLHSERMFTHNVSYEYQQITQNHREYGFALKCCDKAAKQYLHKR